MEKNEMEKTLNILKEFCEITSFPNVDDDKYYTLMLYKNSNNEDRQKAVVENIS